MSSEARIARAGALGIVGGGARVRFGCGTESAPGRVETTDLLIRECI